MSASYNQEPLDVLIQRITNPLNQTYDPSLVYTFCERVKQQQDGPVAATRLLAYRIQSPQEREAMLALDLLDTCARTGGSGFQAELGKFRFLNELIKLLSPRYLGARTPQRVKQRVADLLLGWSRLIPHETKIQEAFALLQKQGLLTMHGITPRLTGGASPRPDDALTVPETAGPDVALDPHRPPTPPLPSSERPQNPIFEDGQKAALLKRLLQSTNPEDIQAANRLIKTMVKQDEERVERVSRRVTELETVHGNLRLLQEMMDSYSPATTSRDELDLMSELCTSCDQLRGKLDSLAAETDDQDAALGDLVSASEQIGSVLSRHRALLAAGGPPLTLLQLESPLETTLEPRPPPGELQSSQHMLDQQLAQLGLSDPAPASVVPPVCRDLLSQPAPPAGPAGPACRAPRTASGAGSSLADLLGSLSPPPPAAAPPQPHRSPQRAAVAAPPLARSAFDDLDDLVRLSMSSSTQPGPTQQDRLQPAPSSPRSTNRSAAPAASLRPGPISAAAAPRPANQSPLLELGGAAGAEPNGDRPIGDLLGDDVSLLSALSGPSSHDSLLSELRLDGGQLRSDESQLRSDGGQPGSGAGQDRAAGEPAATDRPPSLAELSVPLEDITPGVRPPLSLFSEPGSLEISLHTAGNRPRADVTVYVITALNRTGRPVSQYTLQAVCDKSARVRLQAPSSAELPAGSPFLPPPAASQVLLLASPQQMTVHLRFMLSYTVDGDVITEMAEATLSGQS